MAQSEGQETTADFTKPTRQLITMVLVLVLVALGAYAIFPAVEPVFLANPYLNGFIALVFLIGVGACFYQVLQIFSSVQWIDGHAAGNSGHDMVRPPRLLVTLATLLRSRGQRMQITASSSQSILDSVATRIDEARDITRYITSLLIFLGLLGTFYGLATTVPAIVDTIRGLAPREGEEGIAVFERLMGGLEAQLGGMGVAFASSLLGLAGSLVVGLLELFASHGQNRFYRELEEWMSSITRLGFASGEGDSHSNDAMLGALMDQMVQQIDQMSDIFAQSVARSAAIDDKLSELSGAIGALAANAQATQSAQEAMMRLAEGQDKLATALENTAQTGGGIDSESRMRLRSIDVQLLRIMEEMTAGRSESIGELRRELAGLSRAITLQAERAEGAARPVLERR